FFGFSMSGTARNRPRIFAQGRNERKWSQGRCVTGNQNIAESLIEAVLLWLWCSFLRRESMKNAITKVPLMADKISYHVVIETPRGSTSKFAFEAEHGLFKLKHALPQGMVFPFNVGFFARTEPGDGHPLDVLVLHEQ